MEPLQCIAFRGRLSFFLPPLRRGGGRKGHLRGGGRLTACLLFIGFWLTSLAGCAHPYPWVECDWKHVYKQEGIPLSLEFDAAEAVIAPMIPPSLDPATINDAERTPF